MHLWYCICRLMMRRCLLPWHQHYTHQQPAHRLQAEHVGIAALHLAKAIMEIHTISIAHVSKACP